MSVEKEFIKKIGFVENIVYHYCSIDALYGIVSSKSLWLTCLESTNDKRELLLGKKLLNDTLNEMIQSEKDDRMKNILEKILLSPTSHEYKVYHSNFKYYGASFVKTKDSLTHWDRYGNSGQGVCIALDIGILKHFIEIYMALPEICTSWLRCSEIFYSETIQKQYIISQIKTMIARIEKETDINQAPSFLNSIYYVILCKVKPLYKHIGFSDENEFRIIFEEGQSEELSSYFERIASTTDNRALFINLADQIKAITEELKLTKTHKNYGLIGRTIRSYYSMCFSEIWGSSLIPEVIIGPKCFQNKKELQGFLKDNGLTTTKVKISEIPLR